VNVTEQEPVDNSVQLEKLSEPPVKVNTKLTVPVGVFDGVVVSATVAVTVAVQLVPLSGMLQLTALTVVDVLSFATAMVNAVLVLVA
jgi:hypothetical protein